jgi:hypothetical protein
MYTWHIVPLKFAEFARWDKEINKGTVIKGFSTHAIAQVGQCFPSWNKNSHINICSFGFLHVDLSLISRRNFTVSSQPAIIVPMDRPMPLYE